MKLLLLALPLLLGRPAAAQKIVERREALAAGQRLTLRLRPADHIRVRAGAAGQVAFRATVNINQNQLNEAFQLAVSRTADELLLSADLDKQALGAAPAGAGDCPAGQGSRWGKDYWWGENASVNSGGSGGPGNGARREGGVCVAIDYEVAVPAGTELRISTINGDISLTGLSGAIQAKSISGDVDLSWPAAQQADLALKTISGEVYADPALTLSNQRARPLVGYEVRGTWRGGGGPALRLESISGNVFFRQQP